MLAPVRSLDAIMGSEQHAILVGDVLERLRALPDACIQVCVTSPPYLALRDYGLQASVWGGDPSHAHEWGGAIRAPWANDVPGPNAGGKNAGFRIGTKEAGAFCACGAWRGCLGQEPTVELFIEHLVLIFDEVRRVLRPDGVCFVNLGDSYAGSGKGPTGHNGIGDQGKRQGFTGVGAKHRAGRIEGVIPTQVDRRKGRGIRSGTGYELHEPPAIPGLKPKDLMLVPERFAIAMQQAGWWVRSHVAWTKKAPMPESVSDRPVSAWEHVWIMTPSERYFWDKEGVRQPAKYGRRESVGSMWNSQRRADHRDGRDGGDHIVKGSDPESGANLRNVWHLGPEPSRYEYHLPCDTFLLGSERKRIHQVWAPTRDGTDFERLRFCPTCFSPEGWVQHFAAFPTELARRCILAATSEHGACVACGAPWRRLTERGALVLTTNRRTTPTTRGDAQRDPGARTDVQPINGASYEQRTTGWEPSCRCDTTETDPCVVLDIFMGSGTTALAAKHLGRRSIGIELSPAYAALGRHRVERDVPPWSRPQKPARAPRRTPKPAAPAQPFLLEVV